MCTHPPSKDSDQQEVGHLQAKKRDLKIKQVHHHLDPEFSASRLRKWMSVISPRSLWYFVMLAYPLLQGIFLTRNQTRVSSTAGGFFTNWAMTEAHAGPQGLIQMIPNSNIHKNHLEALLNADFGALLSEFLFIIINLLQASLLVSAFWGTRTIIGSMGSGWRKQMLRWDFEAGFLPTWVAMKTHHWW